MGPYNLPTPAALPIPLHLHPLNVLPTPRKKVLLLHTLNKAPRISMVICSMDSTTAAMECRMECKGIKLNHRCWIPSKTSSSSNNIKTEVRDRVVTVRLASCQSLALKVEGVYFQVLQVHSLHQVPVRVPREPARQPGTPRTNTPAFTATRPICTSNTSSDTIYDVSGFFLQSCFVSEEATRWHVPVTMSLLHLNSSPRCPLGRTPGSTHACLETSSHFRPYKERR